MFCWHCNAELPPKAIVCFFCGEKVPFQAQRNTHQKRGKKLDATTLFLSPQFVRAITPRTGPANPSLKKAQKQVNALITQVRTGTVTYETLFSALLLDCTHHNRFINELRMYYDAYDLWTEYSDLLTRNAAQSILLPQFNLLCEGMLQTALAVFDCDTKLTTQVLSYPGLKRWLVSCIVTMLLMDLARTGQLTAIAIAIASDDRLTREIKLGSGLWQEQMLLAQKANPYTTSDKTDQEAIESFIRDHDRQVGMRRKEHLQHVLLEQIATGLLYGQISLCDVSIMTCLLFKKLDGITKDYELILFLDLIKTKWPLFAPLQIAF